MLDSGSSVSGSLSCALWKHFSQSWVIYQRNFIARTHKPHLCNRLMLLQLKKKKKKGEIVSALYMRSPYNFLKLLTVKHD